MTIKKLTQPMTNAFSRLGFTMIELLIVIAIIGVLATVVLASLNPIEQINKTRDLSAVSDASQLVNATERYFASQEKYPWNVLGTSGCNTSCTNSDSAGNLYSSGSSAFPGSGTNLNIACPAGSVQSASAKVAAGTCLIDSGASWLGELTGTNEVKETFTSRIKNKSTSDQRLYIYKVSGTSKSVMVCFRPASIDQKKAAMQTCISNYTSLTSLGLPPSACPEVASFYVASNLTTTNLTATRYELICMPLGGETKAN